MGACWLSRGATGASGAGLRLQGPWARGGAWGWLRRAGDAGRRRLGGFMSLLLLGTPAAGTCRAEREGSASPCRDPRLLGVQVLGVELPGPFVSTYV